MPQVEAQVAADAPPHFNMHIVYKRGHRRDHRSQDSSPLAPKWCNWVHNSSPNADDAPRSQVSAQNSCCRASHKTGMLIKSQHMF